MRQSDLLSLLLMSSAIPNFTLVSNFAGCNTLRTSFFLLPRSVCQALDFLDPDHTDVTCLCVEMSKRTPECTGLGSPAVVHCDLAVTLPVLELICLHRSLSWSYLCRLVIPQAKRPAALLLLNMILQPVGSFYAFTATHYTL